MNVAAGDLHSNSSEPSQLPCMPNSSVADNRGMSVLIRGQAAGGREQRARPDLHREEEVCSLGFQQQPPHLQGAVARICRDTLGRIIDGFIKSVEVKSAEQAKAQALIETLEFISWKLAPLRSEKEIHIHSDCSTLLNGVPNSNTLS